MPDTAVDTLHADIAAALTELRGARAIQQHNPGNDSDRLVADAQQQLDELLEQLP